MKFIGLVPARYVPVHFCAESLALRGEKPVAQRVCRTNSCVPDETHKAAGCLNENEIR